MDDSSSSSLMTKEGKLPPLRSAPPPVHTIALAVLMLTACYRFAPSLESIDAVATPETFSRVLFPDYCFIGDAKTALGYVRLFIAFTIWCTTADLILTDTRFAVTPPYLPGSKLLRRPITLTRPRRLCTMTCIMWNTLGLAFTLSGVIALQVAHGQTPSKALMRTAFVLWETSAPFTLLIAAVIRYAMWPAALKSRDGTEFLKTRRNYMMHNANVLYAITEASLLGGLPVRWTDFSFTLFVGAAYVIFSWSMSKSWSKPEDGPQFLYFFLDTTLGIRTTVFLLVLSAILLASFAVFVGAGALLRWMDGGILTHALFVLVVCSLLMRFRD